MNPPKMATEIRSDVLGQCFPTLGMVTPQGDSIRTAVTLLPGSLCHQCIKGFLFMFLSATASKDTIKILVLTAAEHG